MAFKQLLKLPGFIDIHVQTREPGHPEKEDFDSCTASALAGGITMILPLPNTVPAITNKETLDLAKNIARSKARCDFALFVGATSENTETVCDLASQAAGLKLYLDCPYSGSPLNIDNLNVCIKHIMHWPKTAPLCIHAEKTPSANVILLASFQNRPIHICHVTKKDEIQIIKVAKEKGLRVTCEVSPDCLFLTKEDYERCGIPQERAISEEDQQCLWDNLKIIDCFTSSHTPHTEEEKVLEDCPPGFAGLEITLPLLLNAIYEGKLKIEDLIAKFHDNPKKIFNLPEQLNTYVEVDVEQEWTIPKTLKYSKSKWTPFAGKKVRGFVQKVVLRGEVVFDGKEVLAAPGFGQDVREWDQRVIARRASTFHPKPVYLAATNVHGLAGKKILDVGRFNNKELINYIFDFSEDFRMSVLKRRQLDHVLKGKVMACVFYESSTKDRCSFACAMQRLGGGVIYMDELTSSMKESVLDAAETMSNYVDVILIRHYEAGTIHKISKACKKPIINLGDGIGEHPTQALLDLFTIREELGTINGLIIAIVGDLKNERTAHSLAKILAMYDVKLRYVSPETMKMPQDVTDYVATHPNVQQQEFDSLEEILPDTDVVYMTRMHKERAVNPEEEKAYMQLVITPQLMTKAKKRMIVLHPLPRSFEIAREFDTDARAAYFRQAEYGLYVRMALLAMVLGRV